jgi:hypothetical protein
VAQARLKIACALVVALAGCGSSGGGTSPAAHSRLTLAGITWQTPASGQSSSCSIVSSSTEILVYAMLHDVSPACAALRHGLSSGGRQWRNGAFATVDQNGTPIQFTVGCALASSDDDEQVTVLAPVGGSVILGNRICAQFASSGAAGWRRSQSGTTTTLASAGY